MRRTISLGVIPGLLLLAASAAAAQAKTQVVLFKGVATEVSAGTEGSKDLWLSEADLKKATRFELKPEGVCSGDLCFPLPEARKSEFIARRGDTTWFNLSEFARLVAMSAAHDAKLGIWYFGPRSQEQNGYLTTLVAPDFTLPDVEGKQHSLSDFRGKKVLLLTWASW
jgi:hypothetical protein